MDIYDDGQAKSPEFLEFSDKIKSDPVNEKGIRSISIRALAEYGKAISSDYVVLVVISPYYTKHPNGYYSYEGTREHISVIDATSSKYVEYLDWHKEGSGWKQDFINKLATDFHWSPPSVQLEDKKPADQAADKKPSVVVFLPDVILERPLLVEKVRKTIMEKFKVSDVPIFIDDRHKSPDFLNFIGGVMTDSAKQQAFLLKKERLVEYGKSTNANPVVAVIISTVSSGGTFSGVDYRYKEDILVVDTESNKYLANVVYDTEGTKSRQDGIDFLMGKLQNEFKLP